MSNAIARISAFVLLFVSVAYITDVDATGFQIFDQSGSCTGNLCAGAAAAGEDASTMQFNSAGLSYIHGNQIVGALLTFIPSARFSNNGSTTVLGSAASGDNGGGVEPIAIIPNFYVSSDAAGHGITVGFGINSPYGLETSYDGSWVGRYQAIDSRLQTLNLLGAVSYRVNDALSVGGGVNFLHADANLSYAIDSWVACASGAPLPLCNTLFKGPGNAAVDGLAQLDLKAWGVGYNLGFIWSPLEGTRVGAAFYSKVDLGLDGAATFNVPPPLVPAFGNTAATSKLTLPEVASLSIFSQLNPHWAVMADVTWTNWSRFNQLHTDFESGIGAVTIPEKWHDSFLYAGGVTYTFNGTWKLRSGLAYDETPVKTAYRTPALPDASRIYLGIGVARRVSAHGVLDIGYVHEFIDDAKINKVGELDGGRLAGTFKSDPNVLTLQYTHSF